jgi:hypothetical protein
MFWLTYYYYRNYYLVSKNIVKIFNHNSIGLATNSTNALGYPIHIIRTFKLDHNYFFVSH